MKILFLSTRTPHHYYLINAVTKKFSEWKFSAIYEQGINFSSLKYAKKKLAKLIRQKKIGEIVRQFPYLKIHPFRDAEYKFDQNNLLPNHEPRIESYDLEDINRAGGWVNDSAADLIIVFGTRPIKKQLLNIIKCPIINIHHAVLPHIRGLDSAVWLIANGQVQHLGTSIHYVTAKLDDGKILKKEQLRLPSEVKLWEVRKYNTELTTRLMLDLLSNWEAHKLRGENNPADQGIYRSYATWWTYLRAYFNLKKIFK